MYVLHTYTIFAVVECEIEASRGAAAQSVTVKPTETIPTRGDEIFT